jgi:hypothetical protein
MRPQARRREPRAILLALLSLAALLGGPLAASPSPSPSPSASAAPAPRTSLPANTYYFNWYDNASPGMSNDNIHLVATGPGTTTGTISLGSQTLNFSLAQGTQQYFHFPYPTIGGPVVVSGSGPLTVTQRVTYFRSFTEIPARTSADTSAWFNWYDNASPGMLNDNFHVFNPNPSPASVDLNVAGTDLWITVPAGSESHATFPKGTIGGPAHVRSDLPVIASQRVQYQQSFAEIAGVPDSAAATSEYFNWYDNASPGMTADNVHVVNVGASTATVTINVAGTNSPTLTLNPGEEQHYSFPPHTIGGPVVVSSTQPIVASQRVDYYGAFMETLGRSAAEASTDTWFPWYDNASPCMPADNIHLMAPTVTATGTISLPGQASISFTIAPTQEQYFQFPKGTIGGPVHVTASAPIIVEQRVVVCPPPPPPLVRKIVVSLGQQHLWAYQNGALFLETDVTTGRPELPTPAGDYHIFYKTSPYEMISPWPYGSPYWYPNTWVNWVLEFREGGYFLHDAPWRTWFGPGSNIYDGTHGCVNVPDSPMLRLYNWAQLGDEVVVQN